MGPILARIAPVVTQTALVWTERLITHAAALHGAGVPAVLAGDFNIVSTPADIYNERAWTKSALIQPEPRAQFARLVGQGWTDALRRVHPEAASWTFWSVFHDSYARDAGMRIDHLLLSPRRQGCYGPGR